MCWKNEDAASGNSSSTLSRVSILVGFICALSYFAAFMGTGWVYTNQSYRLTNLNLYTSVTFKIGLWKTCHSFKRINATIMLPPAGCTVISYFNWSDVTSHSLGINSDVEPTLDVLTRIRWCTVFVGFGFILLLIGFVYSVFGHFYQDNKTLLASAIYTLSGLSMAAGLFVLVCVLTDSFAGTSAGTPASADASATASTSTSYPHGSELQPRNWNWNWSWSWSWSVYEARTSGWRDYRYGWCFVTAGAACVLVEMAAVLCMTVHYRRCHTIALLIKSLVPRTLEPDSRNAYFALTKDAGPLVAAEPVSARREQAAAGLGSATPPDLCSTFSNGAEHSSPSPSDAQPAESSVAGREARARHGAGKRANCAHFDTGDYRRLDYSAAAAAAAVREYSTLASASAGCKALASPQSQHAASASPSAAVGGPVRWCHRKTATATATATMPRMKSACCACANAGKWRAADKQPKRAQPRHLSCDDFDL